MAKPKTAKTPANIAVLDEIAIAIHVQCTQERRFRAGFEFVNAQAKRIPLSDLTPEQIKAIDQDPYLKITYETEGEEPEQLADDNV